MPSLSHLLQIKFLNHIYFNETAGELAVNNLSISPCPNLTTLGMSNCYLTTASCGALIHYVGESQQTTFPPSSMRIRLRPNHIKMFLDLNAIDGLEIVTSKQGVCSNDVGIKTDLFRVVDHTNTRAGKRLLRRDFLEPFAVRDIIKLRQEAVLAFCSSETMHKAVVAALKKVPDLERSIATLLKSESMKLVNMCVRLRSLEENSSQVPERHPSPSNDEQHGNGNNSSPDEEQAQIDEDVEITGSLSHQQDSVDGTESSSALPTHEGSMNSGHAGARVRPSDLLIQTLINVKTALSFVPNICNAITGTNSSLLGVICSKLRAVEYTNLYLDICSVIEEDAKPMKDIEAMQQQAAFAIKSGRIGKLLPRFYPLYTSSITTIVSTNTSHFVAVPWSSERLDLYRELLVELKSSMEDVARSVRQDHNLKKVHLKYHVKRGYHLTAPHMEIDRSSLPPGFILLDSGTYKISFTTSELEILSIRFEEALTEIWTMTAVEVGSLIEKVLHKDALMALYGLCDYVALLDVLTSFVNYAAFTPVDMALPRFYSEGPLILKRAHHPLLLHVNPETSVPNSMFMCLASNVHIITGRNQAGKSTFIRMVGANVVLAHIGCFVPAEAMVLPIMNRICARLNNNQDMTQCASHFSREMRDLATIQKVIPKALHMSVDGRHQDTWNANAPDSTSVPTTTGSASTVVDSSKVKLILIDELGRATSATYGFAVAWAVLEDLARTPGVYSLFTTHFHGLTALTTLCPTVQAFYCEAMVGRPASSAAALGQGTGTEVNGQVKFTYKLVGGSLEDTWYGLETARQAGFPTEVTDDAEQLKNQVPATSVVFVKDFLRRHVMVTNEQKGELKHLMRGARFYRHKTLLEYSGVPTDRKQELLEELKQQFAQPTTESASRSGSRNVSSSRGCRPNAAGSRIVDVNGSAGAGVGN